MTTIKRYILTFVVLINLFSCSKDDSPNGAQDPIQEQQETEDTTPIFSEISPLNGPKGTLVTITGKNFGADTTKVQVYFNRTKTALNSLTDTRITAKVPNGAGSGIVKVIVDGDEAVGPEFIYEYSTEISTLAGDGSSGFLDGPGTDAKFSALREMITDKHGNLYVADFNNDVIRKITPQGVVSTYAGSTEGYEDGPAVSAKFNGPWGLAMDSAENLYVSDAHNNRIRKISHDGIVSTLAGGKEGYADGNLLDAKFSFPTGLAIDSLGTIYVADNENHKIRKITNLGIVVTLAGSDEGLADGTWMEARFSFPYGLDLGPDGNLYVADKGNHRIRKITPEGTVGIVSGSERGFVDGPLAEAKFSNPIALKFDTEGNLYVVDRDFKIRKITIDGQVTTVAGGEEKGFVDGPVSHAKFDTLYGIAFGQDQNIYVADGGNYSVRKISQE